MGVFSRLSDIINSNINSMLDKAEDPEKIARLIIQEMEDCLVEVRSAAARSMADKKEYERDIVQLEQTRLDWTAKAELAVEKGREDLARGALSAKQRSEREIDSRRQALKAIDEVSVRRQDDLEKLQAKLDEAKAKHRALVVRREAAEHRIAMRSRIEVNKVDEAMRRYGQIERKVDEMEAYADLINVGDRSLEAQFQELAAEESIEKELAEIKRRRGGAAPAATPAPTPVRRKSEGEGA
ncbi:MAG TPA: phage shock protein PspA [Hyphomonadaceae bacterium]|nr:phage shock protein PspA [Hyphomonadaceae bacterium]HPN04413.1 phage shock protein PspA [Hyphomonadaceae bacterium]